MNLFTCVPGVILIINDIMTNDNNYDIYDIYECVYYFIYYYRRYKKLPEVIEQQKIKKRQDEYSLNRVKARLFNRVSRI